LPILPKRLLVSNKDNVAECFDYDVTKKQDASKRLVDRLLLGLRNRGSAGSQDVHFEPEPSHELRLQARIY
jgi:hypothetical protein